jgi:hypothetical protein
LERGNMALPNMVAMPTTEQQIATLTQEIRKLQTAARGIRAARMPLKLRAGRAANHLAWFRFTKWLRAPANSYDLWKLGFVIIGSFALSAVCFIVVDVFYPGLAAWISWLVSGFCAAFLLGILQYFPTDSQLLAKTVNAEIESQIAHSNLKRLQASDGLYQLEQQLANLKSRKAELHKKVRREIASGIRQRQALLQRNWKAMRDNEWEDYLVEVFRALGASARRIGCAGDQGVDLIVEFGPRRIAIQAKGYHNSVSNKAIQEVYTGMCHHNCVTCAVITNSRFTSGAREIAQSTHCILISEDEIPDLVMGNFRL